MPLINQCNQQLNISVISDKKMQGTRYKIIIVFFIMILMVSIFLKHLFAAQDFDMIRNLGPQEQLKSKDNPEDFIVRPHIEYETKDLRDPFQSPEKKEDATEQISQEEDNIQPLPSLTIQGIVWGGSLPQAIINNKVVKVGDMIEEARIISINKDGVTVFFGNREYNLSSPAKVNVQGSEKR
jgi:hypothetical protein